MISPDAQDRIDEILHQTNIRIANEVNSIDAEIQGVSKSDLEQYILEDPSNYGWLRRSNLRNLRTQVLARAEQIMGYLWDSESPIIKDALQSVGDVLNETTTRDGQPAFDITPGYINDTLSRAHSLVNTEDVSGKTREEKKLASELTQTQVDTRLRRLLNHPKRRTNETKKEYESRLARGKTVLYSDEGNQIRSRLHKGVLTNKRLDEEEVTIYKLRNRIVQLELDIKARYGGNPNNFRGTPEYEEIKKLRKEFDVRSKVWVKDVLNISGIKTLAYSETVKQLQLAHMLLIKGYGYHLARWTLSPFHPRTDICDVCANEIWIENRERVIKRIIIGENKREGIDTETKDFNDWLEDIWRDSLLSVGGWEGVVLVPSANRYADTKGLVIPALAEWTDDKIKETILSYGDQGLGKPDTRRKLAGSYPPHNLCKCRLLPIVDFYVPIFGDEE